MLTFPHFQTRMLKCEKASQETDETETSKKWMVEIWKYPIYPKQDDQSSKDRCGNPPTKNKFIKGNV